jgi:hypothetical protein
MSEPKIDYLTLGPWRTGHKVRINVYDGDRPICMAQTEEDAAKIVRGVNFWEAMRATMSTTMTDVEKKRHGIKPDKE